MDNASTLKKLHAIQKDYKLPPDCGDHIPKHRKSLFKTLYSEVFASLRDSVKHGQFSQDRFTEEIEDTIDTLVSFELAVQISPYCLEHIIRSFEHLARDFGFDYSKSDQHRQLLLQDRTIVVPEKPKTNDAKERLATIKKEFVATMKEHYDVLPKDIAHLKKLIFTLIDVLSKHIENNVLSDDLFAEVMNKSGKEILQQIEESPKDSEDNEIIQDTLDEIAEAVGHTPFEF